MAARTYLVEVPRAYDACHRIVWYLYQAFRPHGTFVRQHDGWTRYHSFTFVCHLYNLPIGCCHRHTAYSRKFRNDDLHELP